VARARRADRPAHHRILGFTLMEMLVVLAVVALLLTLALPKYFSGLDRARESVLVENLATTRTAIDNFYADQGRYPDSLEELVARRYLKALPMAPITKSNRSWVFTPPEPPTKGAVQDLHSGARGQSSGGKVFSSF